MEVRIKIKPLSVNKCFRSLGNKTVKSRAYRDYEQEMMWQMTKFEVPEKIKLIVKVGFSNKLSDIDNILKPLLDILQKKYRFNDRNIYELKVRKEDVKKGEDYISYEFIEI